MHDFTIATALTHAKAEVGTNFFSTTFTTNSIPCESRAWLLFDGNREIAPPKFSKTYLVVTYIINLQSIFFSRKYQLVAALLEIIDIRHSILNDSQIKSSSVWSLLLDFVFMATRAIDPHPWCHSCPRWQLCGRWLSYRCL